MDYRPVLYHHPVSFGCARVRLRMRSLRVDARLKDVMLSRRHRDELRELLDGQVRVPVLVLADEVIVDKQAILRYLDLRYGHRRR